MANQINNTNDQVSRDFIQSRVCDLLQWKPEEYAQVVFNTGLEYLIEYLGTSGTPVTTMAQRKVFWAWWQARWDERDQVFCETFDGREDQFKTERLRMFYRGTNSPDALAAEISIPSVVFGKEAVYHTLKA